MSSEPADDRSTTEQILSDHGVGQDNGATYAGTKRAMRVLESFVSEYVDQQRVISSRSIANAVDEEIRVQEIGKTLAAHLDGETPEHFLSDMAVSKWSDTQPIKWAFKRVGGEADTSRSRRLRKTDLVREISRATDAEGARYRTVERGGARWEKADITLPWMQDVLEVVCEAVDYTPEAVDDDEELTRREWVDELTQAGTTQVLERALGIEAPGVDTSWNKATLATIHDIIVEGRNPSEVDR